MISTLDLIGRCDYFGFPTDPIEKRSMFFITELTDLLKFDLNFSSSSFAIRVNLLHPQPSSFHVGLFNNLFVVFLP